MRLVPRDTISNAVIQFFKSHSTRSANSTNFAERNEDEDNR